MLSKLTVVVILQYKMPNHYTVDLKLKAYMWFEFNSCYIVFKFKMYINFKKYYEEFILEKQGNGSIMKQKI